MNAGPPFPVEEPLLLLKEGAAALKVTLPLGALPQFRTYLQELQVWNARVNLTGLKSDRDLVIKGFLDSLAVLPLLQDVPSLVDLGSGAGFPGLVLKLARPELALTLVESRGKKAAFLDYLVALWPLSGVEVVHAHLTPKLAREWGSRFAAATSRATFSLKSFLELAAPLLLPGGRALALKGPKLSAPEFEAAQGCLAKAGLEGLELKEYRLPGADETRLVAVATKREN
jgi:16S rRNA (guanine527-N7)-methyltransferase